MREEYEGNLAEPLVDDALWGPLEEAVRSARRSIAITQLFFEPTFRPRTVPLCDLLEEAGRRGARVRILVNENAAIPDSWDELRERFAATPVEVRALRMTPNVLHMKVFLIDEEDVFLVDAPFEQKYCDTSAHASESARRDKKKPLHSVSLHLRGPCVARVRDLFESVWTTADEGTPPPLPERPRAGARAGPHTVRLAWTAPAGLLDGPTERVAEEYVAAIGRAKDYIYIENQYFTSPRITQALRDALAREPGLEVIMTLNVHMDVPTYDTWQARRLEELGADAERVGVFALWSPRRRPAVALRQVYVHSKVCIIDDEWATVGSSNLDSISLHEADEFLVRAPQNVELNAIVEEREWATDLRRRLWAEHLRDEGVWRTTRPRLADWRRVAEEDLRKYVEGDPTLSGRLFPFDALAKEWRKPLWGRHAA